jgi:hypothetical protein
MKITRSVACAALLAGTLLSLELARDPAARAQDGGEGFGAQIAGVYLLDVTFPGSPSFRDVVSVWAGGTFQTTFGFNAGDILNGFLSVEHGVWEALGQNRIATTSMIFTFDSNGRHTDTHKVRSTVAFSRLVNGAFQEFTGDATVDLYDPGGDPIMDPPLIPDANQATFAGKRLNVE